MLDALNPLIESRIRDAQSRGEFDDLPGAGRPLPLDEDPLAPAELKSAWRLLRGAGLVGPGTPCDVPMPNAFATMLALVDRALERTPAGRRHALARDTRLRVLRDHWLRAGTRR
ncbi:MAG: DUF1992 domain-containing protein [Lautropia sp.]